MTYCNNVFSLHEGTCIELKCHVHNELNPKSQTFKFVIFLPIVKFQLNVVDSPQCGKSFC